MLYFLRIHQLKVNFSLFGTQPEFVSDLSHRFTAFAGGFRSGKTRSLMAKAVYLSANNPKSVGAICLPTHGMAIRGFLHEWIEFLEEHGIRYRKVPNMTAYDLYFNNVPTRVLLLSSENYLRARNLELCWFGLDETDAMVGDRAFASWDLFISRLSGGRIQHGFAVSTPEGYGFMYEKFQKAIEDKPELEKHYKLYRASTSDNPYLPDNYIESLQASYTAQQIRSYVNGEFCNLTTGNVYYAYERVANRTELFEHSFHRSWPMYVCVDFNAGINATAIAFVDPASKAIYIVDEVFGQRDTTTLIAYLKQKYSHRKMILMCDASGNRGTISEVSLFTNANFDTSNVERSNPLIEMRVASVNSKLRNSMDQRTLFVNDRVCKHVVQTLEQQGYVNGKPDKGRGLDHMADAIGYMVWKLFPIRSRSSGQVQVYG
jgi:hypothetical protein